jgi:glycosyltransferase involved in cell wall biosynthesis
MINIGIDGRTLQGNLSGVGRYVFELCKELDRLIPNAVFFVYSQTSIEMPIESDRWIPRVDKFFASKYMKPILWLKIRCAYLCKQDELDVFWGTATFLPKLNSKVKTIVTIYDLVFKLHPDTMSIGNLWAHYLFFKSDFKRANIHLSISEATSKKLRQYFDFPIDKVVKPAISNIFYPRSSVEVNQCLDKYNIKSKYILAVATWNPRKNIETLIQAFLLLKLQGYLETYQLILVGQRGWKDSKIADLIQQNQDNSVVPLGFVPEELMPCLYTGADVFVYPSIYEGFGIPVIEALACGTTVITSDIPEIREAGGSAPIYVQPTIQGIQQGLLEFTKLDTHKSINKQKPLVSLDSWEESAKVLASVLI